MSQYEWENALSAIRIQVTRFVDELQGMFGENLTGIYLHGSLAMGCFNPDRSDLDLLVVIRRELSLEEKRRIVEFLLQLSNAPAPIETSVLVEQDIQPWQYPTPFELHYSEAWREPYQKQLANGEWKFWRREKATDSDLAAHLTIARNRGICLYGTPIQDVMPCVPTRDYVDSIIGDLGWAKTGVGHDPEYFILNACRVYAYLQEGKVLSKDEAGVWALSVIPKEFHALVCSALAVYRGEAMNRRVDQRELNGFARFAEEQIKRPLPAES